MKGRRERIALWLAPWLELHAEPDEGMETEPEHPLWMVVTFLMIVALMPIGFGLALVFS